jgi:hypothetical protein
MRKLGLACLLAFTAGWFAHKFTIAPQPRQSAATASISSVKPIDINSLQIAKPGEPVTSYVWVPTKSQ